jgi:hypothetical protein
MTDFYKEFQPDIEKLFKVYMDWVEQLQKYPKKVLESFQDRILATYDTVDNFFQNWMENNSENRRKYLKLLSELLKLT